LTGGLLRKKRSIKAKPPQYDDGVVRLGQCLACGRDSRLLTKHDDGTSATMWSCADTEDCCQVSKLAATVSPPRKGLTDAARKVIDDGD